MTTIRRIPTSKIDGNNSNSTDANEIRPYGEIAVYVGDNNKLELLMFDGVRTHLRSKVLNKGTFYGGDADSGDGEGLDTIKLVPDEVLRRDGSDQYLIIDPTGGEPNHIHIRAGGTIDSSSTDLFLGGEKNNVRVSDINDRVTITTDAGEGGIKTWLFDGGGAVTFPDSTVQTTAYTGSEPTQLSFEAGADEELISHSAGFVEGDPVFQIRLNTHLSSEAQTIWGFGTDGGLSFPDGSVQTTAYALPSGPLYVIVNSSKEISTSTNGEIWTTGQEITTSATNFQRVAVGTNAIVYIGGIVDPNDNQNEEDAVFYQTTIGENATAARVTQFEIGAYDFKEVIWAEGKFVLVGHTIVEGPNEPVLFTSTNGINWTATDIDPSYVGELGVNEFDDVYYDGTGFLITATGGEDDSAGGFYVTDPTSALGQNDFVPFVLAGEGEAVSVEFEELAYGGTGWIARAENDILHSFTGEFAPGQFEQPAVWTPLDVATPFKEFCGLNLEGDGNDDPSIIELEGGVIDGTYWIIFTTDTGHVGATSDLGANWTFSIPEPDTATMSFVTIDEGGITSIASDANFRPGEKITISNSGLNGLDGTYYVDNPGDSTNANILYTDSALTTPKISQEGGTPNEGNIVTRGVGVYLDAASVINGFMYVANDDEQIFRSTDGETWTKVDDQNNSFSYWNDIGYNPQFGQAGLTSSLTNGEYTLTLESNGVVTLPAGGTISEGVVTENPTIELTPANPEVESQKLVIKGGALEDYHLHLTTGDLAETSIFLGTDEQHFKVSINGSVEALAKVGGSVYLGTTDDAENPDKYYIMLQPDGMVNFSSQLIRPVFEPSTSKGQEGDRMGMFAFSAGYFYYCTANYSDGQDDIWRRVAWSNDTWGG